MKRDNINDMLIFVEVAKERSFTKAAAKLGVSQSALSHSMKKLEDRLGVQLLVRTTRSVAPTETGERILKKIKPRFEEIEAELAAINELREKPAGTIRITASDHAIDAILIPKLKTFLAEYPDIKVELTADYGRTDIVAERYDAGVRYDEFLTKDMIAVRIGPDARMLAVASPEYFTRYPRPKTPQELNQHNCINLRQIMSGGLYAWELEKKGHHEVKVHVDGQLTLNGNYQILHAARLGMGLAFIPKDMAAPYLQDGSLEAVLDDWSLPFPGFYLYYPRITQPSLAFMLLVETLRYRPVAKNS
ncbi:LysR family transcriptional regulator [Candidatus Jidaibacter acanthamoebae]|nr:LysR family transcriptional regulator [Candidatus Jidaibacter acanthamoeba]